MVIQMKSSKDFTALVEQLQKNPQDPYYKMKVMQALTQIKTEAKNNPLALYQLAKVYPPQSVQYRKTLLEAADLGLTNAMFDAYKLLIQSNQKNDQEKANSYLKLIYQSEDTFIINSLNEYLGSEKTISVTNIKNEIYSPRFFNNSTTTIEDAELKQDMLP